MSEREGEELKGAGKEVGGGAGTKDLGVSGEEGEKVRMEPDWRPMASCLPFGDHDTVIPHISIFGMHYMIE